ncbi:MAG: hypothetical protein LUI10_12290 [Lachnospiraceae bacterium]|nr:hypothetical protein [Lachnospiraceae bacterium]
MGDLMYPILIPYRKNKGVTLMNEMEMQAKTSGTDQPQMCLSDDVLIAIVHDTKEIILKLIEKICELKEN